MNDDQNKMCPNCGAKLPLDGFCIRCGYNENKQEYYEENQDNQNDLDNTYELKKAKSYLRVSILNMVFFLPIALLFVFTESIIGFFSGDIQNVFAPAIIAFIYILCSICFLVWSLTNVKKIKNNKL